MKSKKAAMTAERAQFMHLFLAETDLRKGKREEGTLGIMQKKRESLRQSRSYSLKAREKREKKKEIQTLVSGPSWLSLYFFCLEGGYQSFDVNDNQKENAASPQGVFLSSL